MEIQMFSEVEVSYIKLKIRDLKEEIEELKLMGVDGDEQLKKYRVKHFQVQQVVKELRQQLDDFKMDNIHVSEEIENKINKLKMDFQENLLDLAPLPDLLIEANIHYQVAQQFQQLVEDSVSQLSNELQTQKDKLAKVPSNNLEEAELSGEDRKLKLTIDKKQKKINEFNKEMDENSHILSGIEDMMSRFEIRFNEKTAQYTQRIKNLDEIKEETFRSLTHCKQRADSMKRHMQIQIYELDRQLIKSLALSRSCQKQRDEVRQRMQFEVNSLQENFESVEIQIRAVQNLVLALIDSYVEFN